MIQSRRLENLRYIPTTLKAADWKCGADSPVGRLQ